MDTPGAGPFEWESTLVDLGPVALIPSYFSNGYVARGAPSGYLVSISHRGCQRTVTRQGSVEIVPGRWANVLSPTTSGARTTEARLYSTAVRMDPRFLEAQIVALTGRAAPGPIEFALSMRLDAGPGAAFLRLCGFLLDQIERDEASFAHPLFVSTVCAALAQAFLLGQPHDHAHLLAEPAPPCGPGAVRLAEEYADAHAAQPIGVNDLAAQAGTTVRSLESGFRVHRGTTPQRILRQKRRWLSRWRLYQSAGAATDPAVVVAGAGNELAWTRASSLTPREREVCEHVSRGKLNKQIAAELGISEKTVQLHRGRGMAKLGAGSAAELGRILERVGEGR